ncbi:MAG: response regulator transcription factor [Anaerolineaceae bacterium]|nr:response regulator transcription factor [Anaerolineaceae bacterium]
MNAFTPGANVLVVDDEGAIRYSISRTLQRVGYQVSQAADGEQALASLRHRNYDVVLTDIRMPGLSGTELLRSIRQHASDAIVIMMTGYASLETAIEALQLGASDYLVKPCSSEELRASVARGVERAGTRQRRQGLLDALRSNLDELIHANVNLAPDPQQDPGPDDLEEFVADSEASASGPPGRNLKLGPLTIYPGRYQIEIRDRPVDLTPTEFDLLLYLAAHRDRVVSCKELVREVRGNLLDESTARDVIRPHISNLRRKLKQQDPSVQLIDNVRGVGYRLSNSGGQGYTPPVP